MHSLQARLDQLGRSVARLLPRGVRLQAAVVALIAALGLSSVIGFIIIDRQVDQLQQYRLTTRDVRLFQEALVDAETGVRGFLLTQQHEYLRPYIQGTTVAHQMAPTILPRLDKHLRSIGTITDRTSPVETWSQLDILWAEVIRLAEDGQPSRAASVLAAGRGKPLMDHMRDITNSYFVVHGIEADRANDRVQIEEAFGLLLDGAGTVIALIVVIRVFGANRRKAEEREAAIATAETAHRQVEQLFQMTAMLQSTSELDDAKEVLRATAAGLIPDLGVTLYVFNNSRDRLDLALRWGPGSGALIDHIMPNQCWALKRGRAHLNELHDGSLRCQHAGQHEPTLELPMTARGELYGLMVVTAPDANGIARLRAEQPVLTALTDSMSLALSSIALREKLRGQALRDGLTGLYNRRFLEEMRERMLLDAQRREIPLSLIMIDLDHFKRLNDRHGHAAGDAALRDVAGSIMATVRATDVVCRYGGEELAVLLPDCDLATAAAKAEQIRLRIEAGSGRDGMPPVTASFGVASVPETATRLSDLFSAADNALYAAKQGGRNQVGAAPLRMERPVWPAQPDQSGAASSFSQAV